MACCRSPLLLQTVQQETAKTVEQLVKLLLEDLRQLLRITHGIEIKGDTQDLFPLLLGQHSEGVNEALQQVKLGEHHVDRKHHSKAIPKLLHPLLDRSGVYRLLGRRLLEQIRHAYGNDNAVDRLSGTVLLEQPQK